MQLAPDDPLDPQIRQFVSALADGWARHPDDGTRTLAETRIIAEEVRAPWRAGGPVMASTRETFVPTPHGDVRLRIHRPVVDPAPQPALIYLHGGGWTIFSLDTHDRIMRELAARAGMVVIGVDYALSPEAKFPLALQQILAVVRRLPGLAGDLGIQADCVAIGGDSAGANLAAATCVALRDAGEMQRLQAMLLIYGCFTDESSAEAMRDFGAPGNLLTGEEMASFWHNYLDRPEDAQLPLAAPMRARLDGLPPAFLIGASCDLLCEQSRAFAARLRAAGVATQMREYAGATHSFLEAVAVADVAGRALADAAAWLRSWLARDGLNATMKDPAA